jgi:hypothetical protein
MGEFLIAARAFNLFEDKPPVFLYCFNYRSKFAHLVSSIAVAALYGRRLPHIARSSRLLSASARQVVRRYSLSRN